MTVCHEWAVLYAIQMKIVYSIIIPHFNIPDLLERCVRSIPERKDIQVIVVDDCSPETDQLHSVLDKLKSKGIEVYSTVRGGSAGRARNVGLEHAKGKWLIFADADDFFAEGFIEICETYADAKEDILFFRSNSVNSDDISIVSDRITDSERYLYPDNDENKLHFRINSHVPWGKMIRRSLVVDHKIRFDETRYANDVMFSMQTGCLAGEIKIVDRLFYTVTSRADSLCANFFNKPGEALIRAKVALRAKKFIEEHGYSIHGEYERFLKILLWNKEFNGLKEIYRDAEFYGLTKREIRRIVNSTGLRYRPISTWLLLTR